MDVTVAIATYGSPGWVDLARSRAIPSAETHGVPVVHVHADTLHDARNQALDQVTTEWVCHLDADDELGPRFFDAISAGTCDVRAPAVTYIRPGFQPIPHMPRVAGHNHECEAACLAYGNWLVVGAVARTQLLRDIGGWRDWPLYEDWDLWARCWQVGATIEPIPKAVYRAHRRLNSRNRAPAHDVKLATHRAIARANGLPVPA